MATRVAPLGSVRRLGARVRQWGATLLAWPHAVVTAWRRPWADMGVVPGTSSVRVVVPWTAAHTVAPAYLAVDAGEQKVIAIGDEAREMEGRAPAPVTVVRPFRNGVVGHFEAASQFLKRMMQRAPAGIHLGGVRVVVAVPPDATPLDRMGVREAALAAGARAVHLVDESLAAALGAGLDLQAPQCFLLVNIGAGTTQIAALGYGGLMVNRSLRLGGEAMDRAITARLKRNHRLWISDQVAEQVKCRLGAATALDAPTSMEVGGRDLFTGVPRKARVTSEDVRTAVEPVLLQITDQIRESMKGLPNEALADVMKRGIGLCGGAAALPGLDAFIAAQVGVPAVRLGAPAGRVARGVQRMLEDKRLLRAAMLQESPLDLAATAGQAATPPRARPLRVAVSAGALAVVLALMLLRPTLLHDAAASASSAPMTSSIDRTLQGFRMASGWARAVWQGVQDNGALRERVPLLEAQLARWRQQSDAVARQNAELSRLLRLPAARRPSTLAAHVALRDPTGWLSSLMLDRGSRGGAKPGMSVVVGDGLLGQVVWVGPTSSRVRLLTSTGSVVACRIKGRKAAGVLYGTGDAACELRYLDPDAPVRAGDTVVTSGLDGVHPPGLPVGRIRQVMPSRDTPYRCASVEPQAPVDTTGTVLMVAR